MTVLEQLASARRQAVRSLMTRLRDRGGLVQQRVEAVSGPRLRVNGRWVLNFASANYLGLASHPSVQHAMACAAQEWGISLAMPRLFATDRLTARLERKLAALVDQPAALVFPSTLHIALDVLPLLAGTTGVLFVDEWAYPITLDGANAAAQGGARIHRFPHNDIRALKRALQAHTHRPAKAIVCDGVYAADGQPAPLREFARLAQDYDASVYVDDAHGVGVLGGRPTAEMPYGHGGGGTPRLLGVAPGNVVHVGSLSKAFGVPVAFVAGANGFIDTLRAAASTHVHSSPPAIPTVAAALSALRVNSIHGETLRHTLAQRVAHFRAGLANAGLILPQYGLFPVQSLYFSTPRAAEVAGRALRRGGIWPVLQFQPPNHPSGGALRFVITAQHSTSDIDRLIGALADLSKHAVATFR